MTDDPNDLGAQLVSAIAKVNRWASKHSRMPIPSGQARLLSLVDAHSQARIGALAEADHCSQPTMTAQVKRLEAQGLLQRTEDATDGRASIISLTEEGRAMLADIRRARSAVMGDVLTELSEEDREVLSRANVLLRRIAAQDADV